MQTKEDSRSGIVRFFDTFFQEQSIKWMLAVGMLILLGSSLMLVTSHWDSYTPVWKYLILLGYTGGLHVAGQISFHSLGLRKTGTGLMALTVLLLPLSFLSLRWFHAGDVLSLSGLVRQGGLLALLGVNIVFTALASSRIFRHFLREVQPTFVISYTVLCLAGALVPALPAGLAMWEALALWGVFAAGAIKVNRHVFWLTETYRRPRICGFFPILLLGSQFLLLFSIGLASRISLEWIGLGCVLTAIPVLLAADALARVFLQVHGQVTRPLPWSIVLPMFIGLSLTAAGVCLAGLRFPDAGVLVPTAALAGVLLGVVAYRTQNQAFTWAMLVGALLAYQCSPVFFRELAAQVVRQGAAAVHESRLPLAFYGLTYLPFLLATSMAAAYLQRRDNTLFAAPMRRFATGLGMLLLAASVSHAKAAFPVGAALAALFAVQTFLFRRRHMLWLSVAATLSMAHGFGPFATTVLALPPSAELPLLPWAVAGAFLCFAGKYADEKAAAWVPAEDHAAAMPICQDASLAVVLLTAAAWLFRALPSPAIVAPAISGGLVTLVLLAHAIRRGSPVLCDIALGFGVAFGTLQALAAGWGADGAALLTVAFLTTVWLPLWFVNPQVLRPALRMFAASAARVTRFGFLVVLMAFLIPCWFFTLVFAEPVGSWIVQIAVTLWAFAEARRSRMPGLTAVGWFALLATEGAALIGFGGLPDARNWLPALWGMTGVLATLGVRVTALGVKPRRVALEDAGAGASPDGLVIGQPMPAASATGSVTAGPLSVCALMTQGAIAVSSLLIFSTPLRVAGALALVGLLLLASLRKQSAIRQAALMLVNWQVLCGVLQLFAPEATGLFELSLRDFAPAALPVALLAAWQALAWNRSTVRTRDGMEDLTKLQRVLLEVAAGTALAASFVRLSHGLALSETAITLCAFAALASGRVVSALRNGRPIAAADSSAPANASVRERVLNWQMATVNVWTAQAVAAACVAYLAAFGVITFGHGISMYAVLAAGFTAWGLGHWANRSEQTLVLSGPLRITGALLPALTVFIALGHHLGHAPVWLGANSLALLLAAGFYFWQGLEHKHSGLVVASAVVLNVALALLWDELAWTDPQFFMIPIGISILGLVELLQSEIPARAHNPLRYVGALSILVSPTFHITGGSWIHIFSLLVASVAVTLVAMGLRIRALMYTGTAFLLADLTAMVVRGSIDNPNILWIAGILLGCLVIGLAAYCERYREQMLQRLRLLTAELETWR